MCFAGHLGLFNPNLFPLPLKSLSLTTCTLIPYKPLKASLILVQPQLIQSGPNLCRVQLLCPCSLPCTIKQRNKHLVDLPNVSVQWFIANSYHQCILMACSSGRAPSKTSRGNEEGLMVTSCIAHSDPEEADSGFLWLFVNCWRETNRQRE